MWGGLDAMSGNTPHWLKGERYQHFGARAYDPVTCIFMQSDPMAEFGRWPIPQKTFQNKNGWEHTTRI